MPPFRVSLSAGRETLTAVRLASGGHAPVPGGIQKRPVRSLAAHNTCRGRTGDGLGRLIIAV